MERLERETIESFAARYTRSIGGQRYFPALKQQTAAVYEQQVGRECDEAAAAAIAAGILSVTARCSTIGVPCQQATTVETPTA